VGDVGHPLLDAARGLQALQLEGDMGATQGERGGNSVLRHLDRALVRVGVTEKSGEVDEDSLSNCNGRALPPPSDSGNGEMLLNPVGGEQSAVPSAI